MGLLKKLRKIVAVVSAAALVTANAPVVWGTTSSTPEEVSVEWGTAPSAAYNGTAKTSSVTVKKTQGQSVLSSGTDYTLTYKQKRDGQYVDVGTSPPKNAGEYQATVALTNTQAYQFASGAKTTQDFTISKAAQPAALTSGKVDDGANTFKFTSAANTEQYGYTYEYSVNNGTSFTAINTSAGGWKNNTEYMVSGLIGEIGSGEVQVRVAASSQGNFDAGAVLQSGAAYTKTEVKITEWAPDGGTWNATKTGAEDELTYNGSVRTISPSKVEKIAGGAVTGAEWNVTYNPVTVQKVGAYTATAEIKGDSEFAKDHTLSTTDTGKTKTFKIVKDENPKAPAKGIVDDDNDTFAFESQPGYTYEYVTDGGQNWGNATEIVSGGTGTTITGLTENIETGWLQVRVKDTTDHAGTTGDAGTLKNLSPFTKKLNSLPNYSVVTLTGMDNTDGKIAVGAKLTANFTQPTTDPGAITYKWYRNTKNSNTSGVLITSGTNNEYTATQDDVGKFIFVEVSTANYAGSAKSNVVEGKSGDPSTKPTLKFITQPSKQTVSLDRLNPSNPKLIAEAAFVPAPTSSTPPAITYKWYASDANGKPIVPETILSSSASLAIAEIKPTPGVGTYYYVCYASGDLGDGSGPQSVWSEVGIFEVTASTTAAPNVSFNRSPANSSIALGSSVDLYAEAAVAPAGTPLTYEWYRSDDPQKKNITKLGVTTQVYRLPNNLSTGTYYYFCRATAGSGTNTVTVDSELATITVGAPSSGAVTQNALTPTLSNHAPAVGSAITATLPTTTTVNNVTYAWYKVHPTTGAETSIGSSTFSTGQKSNTITLPTTDISGYKVKVVVSSTDTAYTNIIGMAVTTGTVGGTTTGTVQGTGVHTLNVSMVAPTDLRYSKNNAKNVTVTFARTNNQTGYVAPVLNTHYTLSYSGRYYSTDTSTSEDATYGPIATAPTNRGTYTATLSLTPLGQTLYTLSGTTALNFTITQGQITVKAVDLTYYTGSGNTFPSPYLSYVDQAGVTYSAAEVLSSGSYSASFTATATSSAGEYPITVSSVGTPTAKPNFTITTANGTLRIISGTGGTSSGTTTSSGGTAYDILIDNASASQQAQLNEAESQLVTYLISYGGTSVVYRVYFDINLRDRATGNIITNPNGSVTVTIPYSRIGQGANQYGIYNVVHVKTNGANEYYTDSQITKGYDGISFTVYSFSPFMVLVTPKDANGNVISLGSATGGTTNTGLGSSLSTSATTFWNRVENTIRNTTSGNRVRANAKTYDQVPVSVLRTLRNQSGVTLEITWDGGQSVVIHSSQVVEPEANRVYYPISKLLELYGSGSTSLGGTTSGLPSGTTISGSGGSTWYDNTKPGAVTGGVWDVFAPDLPVLATFTPTPSTYGIDDTIPSISLRSMHQPSVIPYICIGISLMALMAFGIAGIVRKVKFAKK